jgi:HSP20 family protein
MVQTLRKQPGDLDKAIAKYQGGPAKPAMDVIEEMMKTFVVKTDLPELTVRIIKNESYMRITLEIKAEHSEETEEESKEEGVNQSYKKEETLRSAARTLYYL